MVNSSLVSHLWNTVPIFNFSTGQRRLLLLNFHPTAHIFLPVTNTHKLPHSHPLNTCQPSHTHTHTHTHTRTHTHTHTHTRTHTHTHTQVLCKCVRKDTMVQLQSSILPTLPSHVCGYFQKAVMPNEGACNSSMGVHYCYYVNTFLKCVCSQFNPW